MVTSFCYCNKYLRGMNSPGDISFGWRLWGFQRTVAWSIAAGLTRQPVMAAGAQGGNRGPYIRSKALLHDVTSS